MGDSAHYFIQAGYQATARPYLPNVFIPGAQKSGTTSLVRYLDAHPECTVCRPKEPSFFCRTEQLSQLAGYANLFMAACGPGPPPKVRVDGSTAYMAHSEVPGRIRRALGTDLRFVFVLRHPVERAISAYWHQVKRVGWSLGSRLWRRPAEQRSLDDVFRFNTGDLVVALEEEQRRLQQAEAECRIDPREFEGRYDDPLWSFRYLRNSCYGPALGRYAQEFGRAAIRVVLLDDLASSPQETFLAVAEHLGIDPTYEPDNLGTRYNETRLPPGRLTRWLRRPQSGRKQPPPPVPEAIRTGLYRLLSQSYDEFRPFLKREPEQLWPPR